MNNEPNTTSKDQEHRIFAHHSALLIHHCH
jgi:hypothetical protein